jgi:cellulose synthase/poly-beta-1,6-N-acetylglucosamine synthase-like glycosyltransferase
MEAKRFLHFALTENFAFKRAIVNHVGNFDARFRQGGEDSDFCIRLISEGYNILYKPDVVVYHLRRGFKSSIKKAWKDGCSRCHVFMKHRSRVLRNFIIVLFNTLAIIFLLMLIACKLIGIFLPTPIVLSASAWIVLSLMHRLYRAFVESRSLTLSSKIFKSFLAYVSYVAFIFTIVSVLLRTLIYKLKVRL